MKYRIGSLFAGIGGICLGFYNTKNSNNDGFEFVWANEIDRFACETYRTNFKHHLLEGDIERILEPQRCKKVSEIEYYSKLNSIILQQKIDILIGGFPCQAFSIAGEMKGFSDHRGNLFWSIIELIKQLDSIHGKPRVLMLENVKNLISHDNGNTYKIIKNELEKLGYIIKDKIINTMHYSDLPQNRERIYILCFTKEADAKNFDLFENIEKHKIQRSQQQIKEKIMSITDINMKVDDKYYYNRSKYPKYYQELDSEHMTSRSEQNLVNLESQITDYYQFYQLRRGKYVRKNKSNVCPTLTANMGSGGHNVPLILTKYGIRKLTPSETLKLQGFPVEDAFKIPTHFNGKPIADSQLYKQAGNSVSLPIIELIAINLLNALVRSDLENQQEQESKFEDN